jgi:hypothetical protein
MEGLAAKTFRVKAHVASIVNLNVMEVEVPRDRRLLVLIDDGSQK